MVCEIVQESLSSPSIIDALDRWISDQIVILLPQDTEWLLEIPQLLLQYEAVHIEILHKFIRSLLFLCLLALLLKKRLEGLLFSEFPNNHRPPCTTMPWNIRPALVVLWGVCWMFNPWSPADDVQLQLLLDLSAGE